jgi:SAM-dependent methyltransferase
MTALPPDGMKVFGDYAQYYDLLYRDKDYEGEAGYVAARLGQARAVLELGSGTGRHALELARLGHDVTGVDMSEGMVAHAEARRRAADVALQPRLRFQRGDARSVRVPGSFDGVLSLFHVLSYQVADPDVDAMLATAAAHLRPGGRFVFDFWYGPAVLAQKPENRTRTLQGEGIELTRRASPRLDAAARRVNVRYEVEVRDLESGERQTFTENHAMRYFDLPEVQAALARAGFGLVAAEELPGGAALSEHTWAACVTAERR